MIKFLITNFNDNQKDLLKRIDNKETTILTTNNKIVAYKKICSNYSNIKIVALKPLIYQIYQTKINKLPILKEEGQLLFFVKAIESLKPNLGYLNNYLFAYINDLIALYQYERNYSLVKSGYQTEVIKEIELIINKYLSLINNKYLDEQGLYQEVLNYLKEKQLYPNQKLIITDLYYLTPLEKEIVKALMENYESSYYYFLNNQKKPGLEISLDTFNFFKKTFKNNYELEILKEELEPEKQFLLNNLYHLEPSFYHKNQYLNLYGASDLYDEVVFVANQIRTLIKEKGYRYSDFAIISNNIYEYENYFDLIFTDNNIYYHHNLNFNENFFDYILRLLEIMDNNINKTTIINLLKTNYYHLSIKEINLIKKDLDLNEDLRFSNLEESLKNYLLNDIIKPLQIPLKELTAGPILKRLYSYLESFKIPNHLNKISPNTWQRFIQILDNIYTIYQDEVLELETLKALFQTFFKKKENKSSGLDEMIIGDLNRVIGLKPKVIFLMGMNEGKVPKQEPTNILLNNFELRKYYQNYPKYNHILISQFQILTAILSPKDKLFLTYFQISKEGNKINEAPLLKKIKEMYKEKTIYDRETTNNLISLRNLTYNHYLTFDNNDLKDSLKEYFNNHPSFQKYNHLINYLPKFYQVEDLNLSYLKSLSLSPSSMDTYNYCAFQYFCKYILKLKEEETFKYDHLLVGTYLHYLLQNLVVKGATRDNIKGLLTFLKEQFLKENNVKNNKLVDYMLTNLNQTLLLLWPFLYDEINNNHFKPKYLEFNLSSQDMYPPLILNYEGIPIHIRGIIDRVDFYEDYIRIIDYKTGDKSLDLNELVYSLNLQLFIYLLFFKKGKPLLKTGGLFYMPAYLKYENKDFSLKKYRLTGMILDDEKVWQGLGGEEINNYIDAYRYNKIKPEITLTSSEMEELLTFTETKLLETARNILQGKIAINPFKNKNFCQYCPYQTICGREEGRENYRFFQKYSQEECWNIIKGDKK